MTINLNLATPGNGASAKRSWRTELEGYTEIGRGGYATVYHALDRPHQRSVAVKILDRPAATEEAAMRFDRERTALGRLSDHPNIVTLFDSGYCEDGRPYLVMEHLPGGSLAELLASGPMSVDDATALAVSVCDALEAAHAVGALHRDVKPENLLRSRYGVWQLVDFGVVLLANGRRTRSGDLVASLAHTAPESFADHDPGASRDVYGVASVLFTALTGRQPMAPKPGEATVATIHRIATDPFPDARDHGVPDVVARLLERSLAKDPDTRPPTAAELAGELDAVRTELGLDPTSRARRDRPRADEPGDTAQVAFVPPDTGDDASRSTRRPRAAALAGVGVALVAAVAFAAVAGDDGADDALTTTEPTPTAAPATVAQEPVPVAENAAIAAAEPPPTPSAGGGVDAEPSDPVDPSDPPPPRQGRRGSGPGDGDGPGRGGPRGPR